MVRPAKPLPSTRLVAWSKSQKISHVITAGLGSELLRRIGHIIRPAWTIMTPTDDRVDASSTLITACYKAY
jgi:hypothetical protein